MNSSNKRKGTIREILATCVACIASLSFGFATQYSSQSIPQLQDKVMGKLYLNDDDVSLFGSLLTLGALIGSILGGFLVQSFGRRSTLIICSIPSMAGWLLIIYAQDKSYLFSGRILTGIGASIAALTAPIYTAEICRPAVRGRLVSITHLATIGGNLVCVVFSLFLNWNYLALVNVIILVILAICIPWIPETPRWLLNKGYIVQARKSLRWLREENKNIDYELEEIENNLQQRNTLQLRELCQAGIFYSLIISVSLMVFQQTTGINAIVFYGVSILQTVGISGSYMVSLLLFAILFLSTATTLFSVDYFGRRKMLIVSGIGIAIGHFIFGLYDLIIHSDDSVGNIQWVAVMGIAITLASFGLGWGAVPFITMSELLPIRARSLGSSLTMIANWTAAFLITFFYEHMKQAMEMYGLFWFYASLTIIAVIYVHFMVPESKGKSLEEIEYYFNQMNHNDTDEEETLNFQ